MEKALEPGRGHRGARVVGIVQAAIDVGGAARVYAKLASRLVNFVTK